MFRKPMIVLLVWSLTLALTACGGGSAQRDEGSAGDGPVKVVATYSILGDLVENVGGESVELSTLVGPNGDAHTFEPAPSDNATLAESAVVFENGLEFETWLDDLYESSGSDAERVVVTGSIEPLPITEEEHGHGHAGEEKHGHEHGAEGHADEQGHEHGEEHGAERHEHGEFDPHVWHDPANAVVMVESIRDALVEADPDNADAYRASAEEYIGELEELDAEVQEEVDTIPGESRVLFTSHDTFGYFADRYGFGVDTALASVSTETLDPSAGETAELVEEIEGSGVPAIFAENVSNPTIMQNVADEAGVRLAPALYTDALGDPGSKGGTYIEMERHNATTIAEVLRP